VKPRQLRRWIVWLLPLAIARALIPAGFMLASGEHGVELVMCSGFGPVRGAGDAEHPNHHADHGGGAGEQGGRSDDVADGTPCPYAIAGSAWLPAASAAATIPAPVLAAVYFHEDDTRSAEPFLRDRIRGPPLA
jgi:hypothetical protein